ncbi:hypothetical protein ACFOGG_14840 [Brenneria rubrifaciens]
MQSRVLKSHGIKQEMDDWRHTTLQAWISPVKKAIFMQRTGIGNLDRGE